MTQHNPRARRNVSSFESCERCDDTGTVPVELERVYDGHVYTAWAAACPDCEEGERRRVSWARRRESWRFAEEAA
jgi:hypothetical protein